MIISLIRFDSLKGNIGPSETLQGSKIHFCDIVFFSNLELCKMNQISRKPPLISAHPDYFGEF